MEPAAMLAHAVWAAFCKHCELRCVHSRASLHRKESRAQGRWDVLIEHETTLPPRVIANALASSGGGSGGGGSGGRPLRLVHMPSMQFAAAFTYAERGGCWRRSRGAREPVLSCRSSCRRRAWGQRAGRKWREMWKSLQEQSRHRVMMSSRHSQSKG